ncbi:MAG: family 20 glycosylhydrolase [Spirochaetaceae bacterium]|nr:family 20 glycosylhydrolase [Spirochaetaceae bacterium]
MSLCIIPRPASVEEGPGRWLADRDLSDSLDVVHFGGPPPTGVVFINAADNPTTTPAAGSYHLQADAEGIRVQASDDKGRWNAMITLRQILRQIDAHGTLPEFSIVDSPLFPERGVMLDISRTRVPTMDTLKELIDIWSELKYNSLQLYTEHTFAYPGHEKVWKDASPYTGEDIETIDEYCRERGIELIPNQNTFGHMERWLRHPEYHDIAEAPDGFVDPWGMFRDHASTLDPSNPKSMTFLKDLLDSLLPHFRSRYVNIGGDEPFDLGKGRSRERCDKEGTGVVYLEFINKIVDEVERRGKTPQFWADIILNYPELLKDIPDDVVVMNWGYESDHPFDEETRILAESGRVFHVCPGTSSWNSLAGRWDNALENIRAAVKWGRDRGASGLLVTDWGDNGHKQQYVVSMPGWFAAASAAWNGPKGTDEDIRRAMQIHLFGNEQGKEAEWLLKLGNLYKENPVKMHNISFLAIPLLDHEYPYYREHYRQIARGGLGRAREIAQAAQSELQNSDGDVWRRQLGFTARLMGFAADLSEPFYSSKNHNIEELPSVLRGNLADRLEQLMAVYAILWKEVCRPGGMKESLDGFADLLELLRS